MIAPILQKYERLTRELRHQKAIAERKNMAAQIADSLELQNQRQAVNGDGFFVRCALYGDARVLSHVVSSFVPGCIPDAAAITRRYKTIIDVTDVLQARVEVTERDCASEATVVQLVLPAGSKSNMEGIWDPCDGQSKKLWIRYDFLSKPHEVLADDEQTLKCPVKREYLRGVPHARTSCCVCAFTANYSCRTHGEGRRTTC